MQKLTSILAVLDAPVSGGFVLRRAVALAALCEARLELLVIEPLATKGIVPQCVALGYPDVTVRAVSRPGFRLGSVVLDQVRESHPDLVIKARSGSHPLRRCPLTANDWRLSQECPVPLMLVAQRAWAKPARLAAAVDVSDEDTLRVARAVMHTAGFLAAGSHGNLDILYTEREQHDETLRMARAVKLAQLVREFHVGCERLQMFDGMPEERLPPLISSRRYDLLVMGAVPHRDGFAETLCPLTGKLVDATLGDVLLVKPECVAPAMRPVSAGEQVAHHRQQFI
jgi:nucleotide-binding universal stress UspA family protein